jgi:hypothetical protein
VLPATCSTGEAFFKSDATGGQNLFLCKPDNTWTQMTTGGSSPTLKALVFDGSTVISGEAMSGWSCGTGSGAVCTASWTPPTGVSWVVGEVYSAGGGGSGSSKDNRAGSGGAGGGYADFRCAVTPGSPITVTVGLGGAPNVTANDASAGGDSAFGSCMTVTGGGAGGAVSSYWGGGITGLGHFGWQNSYSSNGMVDSTHPTYCNQDYQDPGPDAVRSDNGGCGASSNSTTGTAGKIGGSATGGGGGGGGGGFNNDTYGVGGVSGRSGAGGNGGAWTSGTGTTACTAGAIPGGGGGGGGASTGAGPSTITGCFGARGEVRVYYIR